MASRSQIHAVVVDAGKDSARVVAVLVDSPGSHHLDSQVVEAFATAKCC